MVGDGSEASSVRGAVQGAQRRLAKQSCSAILREFADASGKTLQANLDALGLTPSEYLDVVVFYDAQGTGRCRSLKVLAMTTPGSRAVGICGARFTAARVHDRRHTEVVLIHETLHTLGLGENPPSSGEITARVLARCGN